MKKILIVCLLGLGVLLPSTTITAKGILTNKATAAANVHQRIVDVTIETGVLFASSDVVTGALKSVKLVNSANKTVLKETCSGYSYATDVSYLPSGFYTSTVVTGAIVHNEVVYIQN